MIPITHPLLLQFAYQHYEAVEDQLKSDGSYKTVSKWFEKNGLGMSLKEAIMASVPLMEKMIEAYDGTTATTHLKDMYKERFSLSGRSLGNKKYTAARLVENLGIKVCPYCNRNYINNVPTQKKVKRTSELDHFFSKDKYPFLAMSFFNLVPVCPSCNLLKHKFDVSASPYDFRIPWDDAVRFNYGITDADFLKMSGKSM
ncbi:HNH endonuclease signature motif containing protein [Neobacillus drentensis]|uniref:HNH endonuclease signature motif containing protein n=1 Tax=Neobacillus drentensis TaxID=220684 RepID=UPI002FFF37ED